MSNLVETITNEEEGLVLRIYCHEDADLDWVLDDDEGPQIYYKHRRYRLGQHEIDPMNFGSEEELIQWLKDEKEEVFFKRAMKNPNSCVAKAVRAGTSAHRALETGVSKRKLHLYKSQQNLLDVWQTHCYFALLLYKI